MKRMSVAIYWISSLLLLFVFGGCEGNSYIEDSSYAYFNMYVRFESPAGSNIADDLKLIDSVLVWPKGAREDGAGIIDTLLVMREGDGALADENPSNGLGVASCLWINFNSPLSYRYLDTDKNRKSIEAGTVLDISWVDLKPQKENDVYTVSIKSPLLFGDDEPHTIRWFVNIVGGYSCYAYRCEVDGKEFDFMDDSHRLYNLPHDKRQIGGIVVPMTISQ